MNTEVNHTGPFLLLRVNLISDDFVWKREGGILLVYLVSVCVFFINAAGFCRPSLELRDG